MEVLKNYINGAWMVSNEQATIDVVNPASQEILAKVPFGDKTENDVDYAVASAAEALKEWRETPVMKRVQPLYKLKQLLEDHIDEIARLITLESGKSFAESKA